MDEVLGCTVDGVDVWTLPDDVLGHLLSVSLIISWRSVKSQTNKKINKKALLLQGGPRDDAVNVYNYVSQFAAASRGFHCDSMAFVKKRKNNGVKYVYLLPINALSDSKCLHYKHQRPFLSAQYSCRILHTWGASLLAVGYDRMQCCNNAQRWRMLIIANKPDMSLSNNLYYDRQIVGLALTPFAFIL